MMYLTHRVRRSSLIVLGITSGLLQPGLAFGQTEVKPAQEATRIAIVKGNDVYVRCGAAESYYPFTKLKDGDLVKVAGEKYDWSRVMAMGPAFRETFGFIRYSKGDTGKFKLATDGKSGITLGKIDIIAPNLDTNNAPKDSWKALVRLDADQTLRVIETIETDKETIQKVALPDSAQGWVSTAYLEEATPDQVKQWADMLATNARTMKEREKPAAKETTPRTAAANQPVKMQSNKPATVTEPNGQPAAVTTPTTEIPTTDGETTTTLAADGTDAGSISAEPTTPKQPEPKRLPTFEDLEAALKKLQREPIDTAEVGPLRELYLDLADRSASDARIVRYSTGRAEQLQVWADLQKKRGELEALRTRSKMSAEETIAVQKALERSAEYVAVGRVAASTIYDGKSLPKLLRLQDASTGRTVVYIQPDDQYEFANLIGNLVGIVGEKNYDGTLRLNIVEAKRIDLLTPEQRTVTVPTDQPRPE